MHRSLEVSLDTRKLVKQLSELRLLCSQIGFAIDNYLAAQPTAEEVGKPSKETDQSAS